MPFGSPFDIYPNPEASVLAARKYVEQKEAAANPQPEMPIEATTQTIASTPDEPQRDDDPGMNQVGLQNAIGAQDTEDEIWYKPVHPAYRIPTTVRGKGHDYTPLDGHEEEYQAHAQEQSGFVEQEGQEASVELQRMGDVYKEEVSREQQSAGDWNARFAEDQAVLQKRMAQIDQAGDAIARHRMDSGRWVKSPAGFLGAISAMLIGAGSGDATVGMKVLNQAIQRDLDLQRQEHEYMQADKLGLQNNVAMFRQLVGDRQAGDMVHEAKMRQTAALKIEEIGSQLRSKEAITRSKMLAEELRKQSSQIMMAVAQSTFMAPQRLPQDIANAQTQFGDVRMAERNQVGRPQPSMGGAQSGGGGTSMARGVGPVSQGGSPRPTAITQGEASESKGLYDGKVDEKTAARLKQADAETGIRGFGMATLRAKRQEEELAYAKFPAPHQANQRKLYLQERREKSLEMVRGIAKENKDVTQAASVFGQLARVHADLKSAYKNKDGSVDYAGIDADLGQDLKTLVGAKGVDWGRALSESMTKRGTPAGEGDKRRRAAVRYASLLQQAINAYGHEVSGGAITPSEMERLAQVIASGKGFHTIDGWVNSRSTQYGDVFLQSMTGVPLEGVLTYLRQRGIRTSGLPVEGRRRAE